jgi:hypothetical protein
MNIRDFPLLPKVLFLACPLLALATTPTNAELLIGISFPSQGGDDNDVVGFDSNNPGNNEPVIDESLLTLPKLHLQDGPAVGPGIRNWSSDPTIKFNTTYTTFREYYPHQINAFTNVFPAFSYSPGPAKFDLGGRTNPVNAPTDSNSVRSLSGKGTPDSSDDSGSSISHPGLSAALQPILGILTITLSQNTLKLDWPADHIGWTLQIQTNPGNSQWLPVLGSSETNHLTLALDRVNACVLFRLVAP